MSVFNHDYRAAQLAWELEILEKRTVDQLLDVIKEYHHWANNQPAPHLYLGAGAVPRSNHVDMAQQLVNKAFEQMKNKLIKWTAPSAGTTNTTPSLFGGQQQAQSTLGGAKPFGSRTGSTSTTTDYGGFGSPSTTTGFGGFGSPSTRPENV